MRSVEFWRWWITDELSGKPRATRYRMTVADALERYPGATRVEGSCRVEQVPDSPGEHEMTSGFLKASKPESHL